jgi:hypothetical protein
MKESYGTLSETINGLKKDGYTLDFNFNEEFVVCNNPNMALSADDFEIDKGYQFEGETNPDDQSILYAISSPKFKVQGVLVNGYGIPSNDESDILISKLRTHPGNLLKKAPTQNIKVGNKSNEATPLRPEEIHVQVLEGKINFCAERQMVSPQKGQMIALKADIPHSVQALEDSFFLLTVIVNNSS